MSEYLLRQLNRCTITVFCIALGFSFCGLFLLPDGRKISSILLVSAIIVGALNFFVGNKKNVGIDKPIILWVIFAYALFILCNDILHGDQYGVIRSSIHVFFFGLLIPQHAAIKKISIMSIIAGGCGIGALSLWQNQYEMIYRVNGFTNAILFSQASICLFLLNLNVFSQNRDKLVVRITSCVAMGFSLYALYVSQSRGVWLSLITIVVSYLLYKSWNKPKKYLLIGLLFVVSAFWSYQYSTIIKNRIAQAQSDLIEASEANFNSSWGLRILAWQSAWLGFQDNPLMGVGIDGFDEIKQQQIDAGIMPPLIKQAALSHAHNQYLQNMVVRGVCGLIFLVAILGVPLYLAYINNGITSISFMYPLSFAVASLSDVPFEHPGTIYIYALGLIYLWQVRKITT